MAIKKETKTRIKVKRIGIRGDEVAILFFSLVFLAFLFISFFRLLPIGKLFDDFIFLFLFGWTKYLVYLVLFSIILPICLNYYFKIKLSFILATFFTLFVISWLVANIILLITKISDDIWWKINPYNFSHLSSYFHKWWDSTIINNYHGFFVQPISFNNWKDLSSFFPPFAAGGIIANFLITICNYGFFITNWVLNLIILVIAISWLVFAKPWLLFAVFYFSFKPLNKYLKQKKINRISKKSLQHKDLLDGEEKNNNLNPVSMTGKKNIAATTNNIKQKTVVEKSLKPSVSSVTKEQKKEILLQDVIQESGTLTPFGQVKQDQKSDAIENDD